MRPELAMCFCIRNYTGTQGEHLSTVKVLKAPVYRGVMLPTVLRRGSWHGSYCVWLCVVFTTRRFMLSLTLLLAFMSFCQSNLALRSPGLEDRGRPSQYA